ncbi:MAG TPA: D-alanyl-D-alanine carboxypeptidase/D-alanyl-D-alanine-endopeptidase [Chitinophagaceae bacterium]|nr:D-alanyl-D-alanine carboxypeptidase/D-alanyl-D-alanine-endopeptidase [Chitinophagaceae bacterium]
MKVFCLLTAILFSQAASSQTLSSRLGKALAELEQMPMFRHAQVSMYVLDAQTGKPVFARSEKSGMVPASVQKLVTSASAYALLGPGYRFRTRFAVIPSEIAENPPLLVLEPGVDPVLGSDRFPSQPDFMDQLIKYLQIRGIKSLSGILIRDQDFDPNPIPDGWIWQDIGNYFGAGAWPLNWQENKTRVSFSTGKTVGEPARLLQPHGYERYRIIQEVKAGPAGSGDQAFVYAFPFGHTVMLKGTVPAGQQRFDVFGSIPDPARFFADSLARRAAKSGIRLGEGLYYASGQAIQPVIPVDSFAVYRSPDWEEVNNWFMKKSINLYGEAVVKAISYQAGQRAATDSGIFVIRKFWEQQGIPLASMRILDGSGLSPSNRISAEALVSVLSFARRQKWFTGFYQSLPEINGIKMKDGYITGVRTYAGYIRSQNGQDYIFAFMVNNADGSPSVIRQKMWAVLDVLK